METYKRLNVAVRAQVMVALKAEAKQRGMLLFGVVNEILANAVAIRPARDIKPKARAGRRA